MVGGVLLAVSNGWALVAPKLGYLAWKVPLFMTLFLLTSISYQYINLFSIDDVNAEMIEQSILGTVLVVNIGFYMWVLTACIQGMKILLVEKQTYKHGIYKNLVILTLISSLIALVLFILNIFYDIWAATIAVWHVVLIIVICIAIFQVAPSELSDRIAFAKQVALEDQNLSCEDDLEGHGGVEMAAKKQKAVS